MQCPRGQDPRGSTAPSAPRWFLAAPGRHFCAIPWGRVPPGQRSVPRAGYPVGKGAPCALPSSSRPHRPPRSGRQATCPPQQEQQQTRPRSWEQSLLGGERRKPAGTRGRDLEPASGVRPRSAAVGAGWEASSSKRLSLPEEPLRPRARGESERRSLSVSVRLLSRGCHC